MERCSHPKVNSKDRAVASLRIHCSTPIPGFEELLMVPVEELAKVSALMCMVDSMVSVEMEAIAAKAEATIGPTGHGHNTLTAKNLKKLLHQTFCRGKWMSTGGTSSPATLLNIEFLKLSRHYPTTSRSFPIHAQYASSGTWRCGIRNEPSANPLRAASWRRGEGHHDKGQRHRAQER